jgi:hypothetical protein
MTLLDINTRLWGVDDLALGTGSYSYWQDGTVRSVGKINAVHIVSNNDPSTTVESLFNRIAIIEADIIALTTLINSLTLYYITPQDHGAVGDGLTNDTTAVQDCIDEAKSLGYAVYLPPGSYLCENIYFDDQTIGAEAVSPPMIYGSGMTSILKADPGTNGIFFSAQNLKDKIFRDFVLDGNNASNVTEIFCTNWYDATMKPQNSYSDIIIKNFADTGWLAQNNDTCKFDNIRIISPTSSTNQIAFNATGTLVTVSDFVCDGYVDFVGTGLKLTNSFCYGISTTVDSLGIFNSDIRSNSITAACIDGVIGSLFIEGGSLTTAVGRNHFKGIYGNGATLLGVTFDGEAGEDILNSSIDSVVASALFLFQDCYLTSNVALDDSNHPINIEVRCTSTNVNNVSMLDTPYLNIIEVTYAMSPYSYTPHPKAFSFLVLLHGAGGGASQVYGAGGGGYSIVYGDVSSLSPPVTVTIGLKGTGAGGSDPGGTGGTTSFGALATAYGGVGATIGAIGVGGIASGGQLNIAGQDGYTGYGGASYGLWGGAQQLFALTGNDYGGGGTAPGVGVGGNGANGIVVIYEFPQELRWLPELLTKLVPLGSGGPL